MEKRMQSTSAVEISNLIFPDKLSTSIRQVIAVSIICSREQPFKRDYIRIVLDFSDRSSLP